jgi:homoserine dehydrogenase
MAVLKFGSSILRDVHAVPGAVHEIYRHVQEGQAVVAVVSALMGETDRLLEMVRALDEEADSWRIAEFLSTGERQSALLLSMALERSGLDCAVIEPAAIELRAEGDPLDSDPVSVDAESLRRQLSSTQVVVLPGFYAVNECGRTVLLGRGGSDDTALFIARELGAACRLVKDVGGIFERDPAVPGPAPRRYATIHWDEALGVARQLVQPKAIRYARAHGLSFEVTALNTSAGSLVGPGPTRLVDSPGPLKIALFGLGTVGYGVYRALGAHPEAFEIVGVAVRERAKRRDGVPEHLLTDDIDDLLAREADLAIEVLAGDGPSGYVLEQALQAGRDAVTANKEVMAGRGVELEGLAHRNGRLLRCSASVGGSLPAIETVRRISANGRVVSIEGVLNGTCNFILDSLASGVPFDVALADAQRLGFAESDPSFDLSGRDAASKLRILARHAFGIDLADTEIDVVGITGIDHEQASEARRGGEEIRLVARCEQSGDGYAATVRPVRLPANGPLAQVRGANNLLRLKVESGDTVVVTGRGAGRWPTSESVFADVMEIYRYRLLASGDRGQQGEQ